MQSEEEVRGKWCCHVRGPDDVIPVPDYLTAVRMSNLINADWSRRVEKSFSEYDPLLFWAAPAIWPYCAESHAEGCKNPSVDYKSAFDMAVKAGKP